ncbi:MAG: 4Fe-4S binding protein [Bacillota bacterium]
MGRWPSLHPEADSTKCISCKQCDQKCSMSLGVHAMVKSGRMDHDECILCGNCVDTCPSQAIVYAFGRPED